MSLHSSGNYRKKLDTLNEPHHEKTRLQGFATRQDSNLSVELQKLARAMKFCIQ